MLPQLDSIFLRNFVKGYVKGYINFSPDSF